MQLAKDVGGFIGALFRHWQGYVTGGSITALLTVYERLSKATLSTRLYAELVFIGFIAAAAFTAWREQRDNATQLNADAARSRADSAQFIPWVDEVFWGIHNNRCALAIVLSIRNIGVISSTAEHWSIYITGSSGKHELKQRQLSRDADTVIRTVGDRPHEITMTADDDMVFSKAMQRIENGKPCRGILFCPDLDEFPRVGERLRIEFQDTKRNVFAWEDDITNGLRRYEEFGDLAMRIKPLAS